MIMWKRSHPTGTYAAYLLDEFPENVRCDGDGKVVWIDKRVRGPRWEGAFRSLAAADELHKLGSLPRMGGDGDASPAQEGEEARETRQDGMFISRGSDSGAAAAGGPQAVAAVKCNEATGDAQGLHSLPPRAKDMWGRDMAQGFGTHKVRSSIGLARGAKPSAAVLGLNRLSATPPSPGQDSTQDQDTSAVFAGVASNLGAGPPTATSSTDRFITNGV